MLASSACRALCWTLQLAQSPSWTPSRQLSPASQKSGAPLQQQRQPPHSQQPHQKHPWPERGALGTQQQPHAGPALSRLASPRKGSTSAVPALCAHKGPWMPRPGQHSMHSRAQAMSRPRRGARSAATLLPLLLPLVAPQVLLQPRWTRQRAMQQQPRQPRRQRRGKRSRTHGDLLLPRLMRPLRQPPSVCQIQSLRPKSRRRRRGERNGSSRQRQGTCRIHKSPARTSLLMVGKIQQHTRALPTESTSVESILTELGS